MNAKQVSKTLKDDGWELLRVAGSHYIFGRDGKIVVVPNHGSKDIPAGTLNAIWKQTGRK